MAGSGTIWYLARPAGVARPPLWPRSSAVWRRHPPAQHRALMHAFRPAARRCASWADCVARPAVWARAADGSPSAGAPAMQPVARIPELWADSALQPQERPVFRMLLGIIAMLASGLRCMTIGVRRLPATSGHLPCLPHSRAASLR